MIGKVIYGILNSVEADVYPSIAPQGTAFPYITYQVISQTPNHTKGADSDLDVYRVQINVFSNSYAEAITLKESVRTNLDYYTGTIESIQVDRVRFDNEQEFYSEELRVYHIATDYLIWTYR